jgi:glutamate/tyrosine decarboxylase-like PLP-dependent enzyme
MAGLGTDALRVIETDHVQRLDIAALADAVTRDRRDGLVPFLVIGTAGTVDTGAIDDLNSLANLCARERLTFHVDGAYGALGIVSPTIAPQLAGIERADSIAFDFHKWAQVPYDAGFILVRDGELHKRTFSSSGVYLRRESRGLAGGDHWPCDYGPDLSRGFRALKTWFTLKAYGTDRLGSMMAHTCAVAKHLEQRIRSEARLELLAPVQLNIVCFRLRSDNANQANADLIAQLQESGIAAPSATTLNGQVAIRAAIFNHRTTTADVDAMVDAVLRFAPPRGACRPALLV